MAEEVTAPTTEEPEKVFPRVRETFYIAATQKLNGAIDVSNEGMDAMTLEDAIEKAVENVREYGDTWFVIECRAVRSVMDRQPCVRKLKPWR